MFKNYLKTAYRTLLRNKISTFINVFGLSVAIGCTIIVYLFLNRVYTADNFHLNAERIFLVESIIGEGADQEIWCNSPAPLGPAMRSDFSQVEDVARIAFGNGTIQYDDKVFSEGFWYVDPAFLSIFTFPIKYGSPAALADENAVVLSEDLAVKYFGQENPTGRDMLIRFGDRYVETFSVGAVVASFPVNSSLRFNMLLNYEKQRDVGTGDLDDWSARTASTFIQVTHPDHIETLAGQMNRYVAVQNAADEDWRISSFTFENLLDTARNAYDKRNAIQSIGHPVGRILLVLISLFLLVLSCFNYMNIALATASTRLKEIGIRKTMGGKKSQLVWQFLCENILVCLLALLFGIGLAHFFLAPTFNNMFIGFDMLKLSFMDHSGLWIFLFSLLLFIGMASGVYPAFFISSFHPVLILKGTFRSRPKQRFMRLLLTFQFTLAFISMIGGIILSRNAAYQNELDWGYDQDQAVVVRLRDTSLYEQLRNDILQHPDVVSVAGSRHHVGIWNDVAMIDIHGQSSEVVQFEVGFGYLESLRVRLKEGRFFDRAFVSDIDRAIVINETFVRRQGWAEPVGRQVRLNQLEFTVVGVIENFHYTAFHAPIESVMFRLADDSAFSHLIVRFEPGAGKAVTTYLENTWKTLVPDMPFDSFYQNTVFNDLLNENTNMTKLFQFMSSIMLLISCMGLFGLSSQNVNRRMKEIGIRKVMGASISTITGLINRGFLLLILIAAFVATPLTYMALNALLNTVYQYHITITAMPFTLSFAMILFTAVLTISLQIYRVIVANPAEVLRNE